MGAARVLSARPPLRAAAALLLGAVWSILAPPGPASAQEAPPRLTVIGVGAGATCEEWLATAGADPELEQWAFGFASAIAATVQAQQGGDPLAALDAEAIHAWLGGHCHDRPGDALSVALVRMVLGAAAVR